MGAIIPQVVSEDRAGSAQIIGGGLRFDSSKSQYLKTTPGSAGNRKTFTWSGWVKRSTLGASQSLFEAGSGSAYTLFWFNSSDQLAVLQDNGSGGVLTETSVAVYRDLGAYLHLVLSVDTTQSTASNRFRIYVNGTEATLTETLTLSQNSDTYINFTNEHRIGYRVAGSAALSSYVSNIYFIDGQALDPSYFGFTDPLTNTWRPKKLSSSVAFGTNGFYLPFDGSAPIGQDQSGKGNNWTPVNFGGSNTIEKATGALPILNTTPSGKSATVGVRTDSNASSLVLALPLVGIKSDFSNAINSGTSNKAVTVTNAVASSTQSNFYGGSFYFDGTGDYMTIPDSTDFNFGNGDFTLEGFAYVSSVNSYMTFGPTNYSSAGTFDYIVYDNASRQISFAWYPYSAGGAFITSSNTYPLNSWFHWAVTRSGNTFRIFINGNLEATGTNSTALSHAANTIYIGRTDGLTARDFNGYQQDIRVYKGVAKYTNNFIPASTDPDIVPDSPSGVSYSSNVALVPSTDGAVAFDGNGDYVTAPYSTDFNFTGDFTLECFVYFSALPSTVTYGMKLISVGDGASSGWYFTADTSNFISFGTYGWSTGSVTGSISLTSGKWYHVACVRSSNVVTIYVDGVANGSATKSGTTGNSGNTALHIGTYSGAAGSNQHTLIGLMSNVHITNTALYTANFTPPSAPISSVANTKLLCCKSNSSATVYDVSPGTITANGNAAASNFNPFTANIKTVRGLQSGYATLSPINQSGSNTLSNGNLNAIVAAGATPVVVGTIGLTSGKWYWEVVATAMTNNATMIGVADLNAAADSRGYASANGWYYYGYNGTKYTNNTGTSYGATYDVNDVIGVALDMDAATLTFYKNGVSQGVAYNTGLSGKTLAPALNNGTGTGTQTFTCNFGQKPFKFPPPAGFQPLTLANLPRPTIVRPDQYVGIVTYTGSGAARSITVGFQPDFVWFKGRNNATDNQLVDSVRGTSGYLSSNLTNTEATNTTALTAFTPSGFNLGDNSNTSQRVNYAVLGDTYVAWAWKAGGNSNTYNINGTGYSTASAAGLTAGTITPTGASVNTKSGFSIIKVPGTASAASFSHGLGQAPAFVILKETNGTGNWQVGHKSLSSGAWTSRLGLNLTTAEETTSSAWNNTPPTSSLITVGATSNVDNDFIVYAWAEIPGFSKFGSWTNNNSNDGTFINCGFSPAVILLKNSDNVENWYIIDNQRQSYNRAPGNIVVLAPNSSNNESYWPSNYVTTAGIDFLSNGFKIRSTNTTSGEISYGTRNYIFAAFAQNPGINLYGAMSNAR